MLLALERGRTPEIDYLNGEIVRRGALLGVATPVNARLCAAIGNIVAGREKSGLPHLRRIYEEVMA
jgi:2-dehydropantoate 2-reductase